jgi:hypothetical protein
MVTTSTFPRQLEEAIAECRESLGRSVSTIERPKRLRLLRAMGQVEFSPGTHNAIKTSGLRRRVDLAIRSTRFALPVWKKFIATNGPDRLIHVASSYLCGSVSREAALETLHSFESGSDDALSIPMDCPYAIGVGFSALGCVMVALGDIEGYNQTESIQDEDLDHWDSHVYSCAAVAGGYPWASDANRTKAHEFWSWWLDDAVPQAFLSVSDAT